MKKYYIEKDNKEISYVIADDYSTEDLIEMFDYDAERNGADFKIISKYFDDLEEAKTFFEKEKENCTTKMENWQCLDKPFDEKTGDNTVRIIFDIIELTCIECEPDEDEEDGIYIDEMETIDSYAKPIGFKSSGYDKTMTAERFYHKNSKFWDDKEND